MNEASRASTRKIRDSNGGVIILKVNVKLFVKHHIILSVHGTVSFCWLIGDVAPAPELAAWYRVYHLIEEGASYQANSEKEDGSQVQHPSGWTFAINVQWRHNSWLSILLVMKVVKTLKELELRFFGHFINIGNVWQDMCFVFINAH